MSDQQPICPCCQTEGAYIGLYDVKCVNKECRHYDTEYAEEATKFDELKTWTYEVDHLQWENGYEEETTDPFIFLNPDTTFDFTD